MGLIGGTKEAILRELKEESKHGYAIAQGIGVSKGGIYSHLQDLEQEGMVEISEKQEEGRGVKEYRLTEAGELLLKALDKAEA